jgi:hypothetical protein
MLALHWILLFLIGGAIVLSLVFIFSFGVYRRNRGKRIITCPESKVHEEVEVDSRHAFVTALRGREELRLKSCSRWPEREGCGQECLAEIAPAPDSVMRLVRKWYEAEGCATCGSAFTPRDWEGQRLGLLDQGLNLIAIRDLPFEGLPLSLRQYRAICAKCHRKEKASLPPEHIFLRGDRRKPKEPDWDWVHK